MSLTDLIAAIRNAFPEALQDQAFVDLMSLDDRSLWISVCAAQVTSSAAVAARCRTRQPPPDRARRFMDHRHSGSDGWEKTSLHPLP